MTITVTIWNDGAPPNKMLRVRQIDVDKDDDKVGELPPVDLAEGQSETMVIYDGRRIALEEIAVPAVAAADMAPAPG